MKLNLPLTYGPKIEAVKKGDCFQTIRELNQERPKTLEDKIRFHTWVNRPYRSKWDWRSPLLDLTEILRIMHDPFNGWNWASLRECNHSGLFFHHAESRINNLELLRLAQMDHVYYKSEETFTDIFEVIHPHMRYSCVGFEVLRWNPKPILITLIKEDKQ